MPADIDEVEIQGHKMDLSDVETSISRVLEIDDFALSYLKAEGQMHGTLIGYAVPNTKSNLQKDLISQDVAMMGHTWEKIYRVLKHLPKARQEFTGWSSMINREPFPVRVMEDFLEDALRPFRRIKPKKVLEVGCGNGIVACHMALAVDRFYGTELSEAGVKLVEEQLTNIGCTKHCTIWTSAAHHLSTLPDFSVDFVMINSVVQYFPSLQYLESVLYQCICRCTPGGHIVTGDVRSAPLNDLLAVDGVMHQWGASWSTKSIGDLRHAVRRYQQLEKELTVDPAFFFSLKDKFAEISHLQILPKHFPHNNELSRYRYQVILHIGQQQDRICPSVWGAPKQDDPYFRRLPELVSAFKNANSEELLAVEKIPFSFVTWQRDILSAATSPETNTEALLGSLAQNKMEQHGWSAADLETLAQEHGLHVQISFARQSEDASFDAVFTKHTLYGTVIQFPEPKPYSSRWQNPEAEPSTYKRTKIRGQTWNNITEVLRHSLPICMIPDAMYAVEYVPLTANGKIDRARLNAIASTDFREANRG